MRRNRAADSSPLASGDNVLPAVDESQLLAMDVVLTRHGIRHALHRGAWDSLNKSPLCVVVDAADADRAAALVAELQRSSPLPNWGDSRFRLVVMLAAVMIMGGVLLVLLAQHG